MSDRMGLAARTARFFVLLLALCVPASARSAEPPAAAPAVQPAGPASGSAAQKKQAVPAPAAPGADAKPVPAPAVVSDADAQVRDDKETYEQLKVFVDSLDQIERNYVKPVSRRELIDAAIAGMLEKLDPYSSYITPEEVDRFRTVVENQFGGIGIQVSVEARQLKIVSPLVGTPAYRAGLMAGDTVVEIDGKPATTISLDEAVRRLKGPVGSKVTITVVHAGSVERQTRTMTREIVHVETVLGERRGSNDGWDFMYDRQKRIGYIRIVSFGRETPGDLRRALSGLQKQKLRGLVLDLRFNPGGLLSSAIETCDLFIEKGRIVSTKGRNTPERVWDAKAEGTFSGFPVAVLVNHYSASASEIVSACLQDHKRAVIVGERTWGKGSVQNVIDLEGGKSVLKLTTASYWRPSGKNIHRFPDSKETDEWGVRPDPNYEVALTIDEMRQLIDDRRNRDIVAPHPHALLSSGPAANSPVTVNKPAHEGSSASPPATRSPESAPESSAGEKTSAAEPAGKRPSVDHLPAPQPHGPSPKENKPPLVDRQLKRALEYLDAEMTRAGRSN